MASGRVQDDLGTCAGLVRRFGTRSADRGGAAIAAATAQKNRRRIWGAKALQETLRCLSPPRKLRLRGVSGEAEPPQETCNMIEPFV